MTKCRFSKLRWLLLVAAACLFWGLTQPVAGKQKPADTPTSVGPQISTDAQVAMEEAKKPAAQRKLEAKQRLAEALKKRNPKLTDAALNSGLLAQPQDTASPLAATLAAPTAAPLAAITVPNGINPAVDLSLPNWSYSPNLQKFVDSLPGLGYANRNNLGNFIPVAVADTTSYPGSDYYEIGLKDYRQRMHSDLPAPGTKLRGYYQKNSADPNVTAQHYLGPLIIAKRDRAVRITFINEVGTGAAGDLFIPVDTSIMGSGMGPDMIMAMSANVVVPGMMPTVEVVTAVAHNLQVNELVMLEGFTPAEYNAHGRVLSIPSTTRFRMMLHMDPGGPATVMGQVMKMYTQNRADLHLHGGNTPWISDGTPHQWITPVGEPTPYKKGVSFQNVPDMIGPGKTIPAPAAGDGKGTYYYTNQQSSRLMFYHDHAYGITRLNVYAGEAAGYLLVDQTEDDLIDGTNVSGVFNNVPGGPRPILPNLGSVYRYGIPLVIQDKSFVNDATTEPNATKFPAGAIATGKTAVDDPLWYHHIPGSTGGDLWFPHEYLPNQNIFDPNTGSWLFGRWDYGPWIVPPMIPMNDVLPSPSHAPEAFMDTMTVNGQAFPYVEIPAQPVRFRILNACNDRMLNLSLFKADPCNPKEVKLVDAAPNAAFPTWPKDGRDGGVPDPCTAGPDMIQIGNECGFLAKVNVVPAQPVDYDYDRTSATFANVSSTALWLGPAVRADVIVDFSQYQPGDVLILYTDAPAPMSLYDGRYDLFFGQQDWRWKGGPPETPAGFGPGTRTIMQIRIVAGSGQAYDVASLTAALPKAFAVSQDQILVPESAYNAAYGTNYPDVFGNIRDESFNMSGVGQGIARIIAELPGFNYTTPPTVRIIPINGGSGAQATATLNGVTGITLITAGSGYTSAPLVTITPAVGDTGAGATATAIVSGGVVTTIVITNPGSNYLLAPTVTLSGGGIAAVQATAQAQITLGSIGSVIVNNPGSGYKSPPLIYFIGGGGTGALGAAMLANSMPLQGKIMVEGMDMEFGRMNAILGSIPNPFNPAQGASPIIGGNFYVDPPTEIYNDGELALWRFMHIGVDSHSMHWHLVNVQVINRVDWTNVPKAPFGEEVGWKETIRTAPFEDIILALKPIKMKLPFGIPDSVRLLDPTSPAGSSAMFAPVLPPIGIPAVAQLSNVMTNFGQEYVWHCHLLGHEENDMMRPFVANFVSTAPTAPSLAVPTQASGVVNLSWTDPTPASAPATMGNPANEIGFRIERAPGSTGGTFTVIANIAANATTYSDASAQGGTYRYRVVIFNAAGTATSNTSTVTVGADTPAAPTNAAAAISATPPTTVTITWTDNSANETGFTIQRSTSSTFGTVTTYTAPANATSFLNTGTFSNGTTYYYRVRATVGSIFSGWSNTAQVRVATAAAPSNLTATLIPTPLAIRLAWRDNSTVESGFYLQRSLSSTFSSPTTFTRPASPGSGATVVYDDNSVAPNTRYYYRVQAFNSRGNSSWSNTVNLLTPGGPPTPGVTIIDNGQAGTSFTGTWNVSSAAGAYGTNSLWSYNGATYTWSFTPTTTATYRVSLWWTALSSRYTAVPVAITHAGGTANMTVNQTTNGGMWNVLGQYTLNAGTTYMVRITAVPTNSPPSTSADAVRWEQL